MAAPIPNGTIPIMTGGVAQAPLVYQQQPLVIGGQQLTPTNNGPSNFIPGKRNFARNPNDEQCKIYVGGVGKTTTEESLRTYFKKFGEIADSVIMQDRETGEPRGFAFVTFKNAESVQGVIEQTNKGGHTLDGQVYLQVRKYFPKAEYDAEKAQTMASTPPNMLYKGPMKVSPELKVFVGGIGIGTTEEDVKNYFNTFGKVEAVDMPYHHIYKCPKGFAFVGFESLDTVMAVVKDRYHQINGKTVEVKGADEQQAHLSKKRAETEMGLNRYAHARTKLPGAVPGTIGTISGYGQYANIGAPAQQVLIPQVVGGQTQYATVQVPSGAAAGGGGYVYDPATNTYYQLPMAAAAPAAGIVQAQAYGGGVQLMANPAVAAAGGTVVASPQQLPQRAGQVGAIYPSETSTFGPSRTHILGAGHQPIAGTTDPTVVYSNSAPLTGGESIPSRGFHPYGR